MNMNALAVTLGERIYAERNYVQRKPNAQSSF